MTGYHEAYDIVVTLSPNLKCSILVKIAKFHACQIFLVFKKHEIWVAELIGGGHHAEAIWIWHAKKYFSLHSTTVYRLACWKLTSSFVKSDSFNMHAFHLPLQSHLWSTFSKLSMRKEMRVGWKARSGTSWTLVSQNPSNAFFSLRWCGHGRTGCTSAWCQPC